MDLRCFSGSTANLEALVGAPETSTTWPPPTAGRPGTSLSFPFN